MTREEATALVYGNPEAAVDLILQLVATVEALTVRVEELERKIAALTRDSSNSSKPPSSDGPAAKPRPRRPMKSKKRKPGGQSGHKGTNRNLIPVEDRALLQQKSGCRESDRGWQESDGIRLNAGTRILGQPCAATNGGVGLQPDYLVSAYGIGSSSVARETQYAPGQGHLRGGSTALHKRQMGTCFEQRLSLSGRMGANGRPFG